MPARSLTRRSARTSPGTTGPRRPPCAGGCGPAASALPNSNTVGASRKMPFWVTRCGRRRGSTPPRRSATPRASASRPPRSSGQETAAHPPRVELALPLEVLGEPSLSCRPSAGACCGPATRRRARRATPAPRPGTPAARWSSVRSTLATTDTMTEEPWPNRPWLAADADPGPSTWRPAGLATELPRDLAHLGQRLGRHRLAEARQAARRVDRDAAADRRVAAVAQQRSASPVGAEAEVLVPVELERGGQVVHLGDGHVLGADARPPRRRPRPIESRNAASAAGRPRRSSRWRSWASRCTVLG